MAVSKSSLAKSPIYNLSCYMMWSDDDDLSWSAVWFLLHSSWSSMSRMSRIPTRLDLYNAVNVFIIFNNLTDLQFICVLHSIVSKYSPGHVAPPSEGLGLSHSRVRDFNPPTQVWLHPEKRLHSLQPPSTATKQIISPISRYNWHGRGS